MAVCDIWRKVAIGLVREASREKRVIGKIAPHLAQPLAFIFPGRKGTSWALWKLAIGVKLYDLLCGMRNFGRSSVFRSKENDRGFARNLDKESYPVPCDISMRSRMMRDW